MFKKTMVLWLVVLLTAVPYSIYYLLFEAPREQYALLIVFVLFWIFGYWPIVGPLITLQKFLKIKSAFANIKSRQELLALLQNPETEAAAIDFIAKDNGVPQFMAKWAYQHIAKQLALAAGSTSKPA
jgi:hypothetical protein